jgi:Zn-finger nucleic acid-binding protein
MSCPCCAAPVPARGVACAYCGHRLDLDLQGWAHLQASEASQELHCPDCRIALEELQLDSPTPLTLGRCPGCLGLFLPLGALERLLDQAVAPVCGVDHGLLHALAETPRSEPAPVRYRPCPSCGELMNRSLQGKRSGVVVDRCRDHGVWLDAGELRQLLEWVRAGGNLHHQQRLQEEQRDAERRQQALREELATAAAARDRGTNLEGVLRALARHLC